MFSKNFKNVLVAWLTHAKILQLVASLQRSRQQVVFALLVTSCQQLVATLLILSDLLRGSSDKVDIVMM